MYEGWKWRDKWENQKLAQSASWITAPHLKKPLDPKKLLEENKPKKKTSPEKTEKIVNELMERMGVS